jgi:hypothetical protein
MNLTHNQPLQHELRLVIDNLAHKMNQVSSMFPNYHETLNETMKKMHDHLAKTH